MLKNADIGCPMMPIIITSGERPNESHVPKKDLIAAVQMMLEMHELRIPRTVTGASWLIEELQSMRIKPTESGAFRYEAAPGSHDDLITALSLAIWPTRPRRPHVGEGKHRLV